MIFVLHGKTSTDRLQIVAYMNFSKLVKDARKRSDPWVVIYYTELLLVLVRIDDIIMRDVEIKVIFNNNFQPMVVWQSTQSHSLLNCACCTVNNNTKY